MKTLQNQIAILLPQIYTTLKETNVTLQSLEELENDEDLIYELPSHIELKDYYYETYKVYKIENGKAFIIGYMETEGLEQIDIQNLDAESIIQLLNYIA